MIAFPHSDTIRFSLPATTHRCGDGRSILVESVSPEGSGVLLQLRYSDSLVSDSYPVLAPGDTAAARGAIVAVRYLMRDVAHGFALDSGRVDVHRAGATIGASVTGSGIENSIRAPTHLEYRDVRLETDTVPCKYVP
jgi:hypothetical protein